MPGSEHVRNAPALMAGTVLWIVLGLAAAGLAGGLALLLGRAPGVEVEPVRVADVDRVLAATGRVVPHRANMVLSLLPGRLVELRVSEGDLVSEGDILARLDDREASAALRRAQASLQGVSEELGQARRDLSRMAVLAEQGSVSRQDLENARLAVDRLRAARSEARAGMTSARARLADHVIRSAFDGRVLTRLVDAGQQVSAGTPILEMGDRDPRIEIEVDEELARELHPGMRSLGAGPSDDERSFALTVVSVAPRVQVESGTVEVSLILHEPDDAPPMGSTIDVNILVARHEDALLVPREAVVRGGGDPYVMLIEDGRVLRREVQVIDWPAERIVVLEGLEAGEEVILDPRSVTEGSRARPLPPGQGG